jgi:hypothetical protein
VLPAVVFHGIFVATVGLLISFLPVEEKKLITLQLPVLYSAVNLSRELLHDYYLTNFKVFDALGF